MIQMKKFAGLLGLGALLLTVGCKDTTQTASQVDQQQAGQVASKDAAQQSPNADQSSTENQSFMSTIQFKGNPIHIVGNLPATGTTAPNFTLVADDLSDKSLSEFKGKYVVLNIFPSVNTGVCAASVRQFNKDAAGMPNATVLCISKDLPFAQAQFCGAEGIKNVVMLSDFRTDFGHEYGVLMADGPLKGLLSRAVVVINPEGQIVYEEQVPEITQEPNYEKALAQIK